MRAVLSTSGEPKAVLVTGGAGFIGSHLVRRLLSYEYRVRVLDNFATGNERNLAGLEELEVVTGDIRSRVDVAEAMQGMNAVFHLAALPSVARSWKDPVTTLATNAHGTANVVDAALDNEVEALVYSSSSSVYGDQEAEKKSEDLELKPISPYGYSKLLGEKIALAHARGNGGLRVVSLRYFNVFGARQDPDSQYAAVVPLFIQSGLDGVPLTVHGDGMQSRDFTYIDSVVQANLRAMEAPAAAGEAFNIACGSRYTLMDIVH